MFKRSSAILLSFLVGVSVCQSQTINDGLLAHYPFSGSANDESGKNNHAIVTGATLATDRFGSTTSAYAFNGTSDYITTSVSSVPTGKLSLCAWVKTTGPIASSAGTYYGIVYSRSTRNAGNGLSFAHFSSGVNGGKWLYADVNTAVTNITDATSIWDNAWHFVVYTYDGAMLKVYVDGKIVNQSVKNITQAIAAPFVIGNDNLSGFSRYFKGLIDDVRIYDRPLSGSEINYLKDLTAGTCTQKITVTDTLVINVSLTGYNPITYSTAIKVYPNPSSSIITIDHGDFSKTNSHKIVIMDSKGQSVYSHVINENKMEIDLSTWSGSGTYFLYLYDPSGLTLDVRKIVLN